jgi:hypothetical protein
MIREHFLDGKAICVLPFLNLTLRF